MYDHDCPNCSITIEDLSNKVYYLELRIEELEDNHSDEVDTLCREIDRLQCIIKDFQAHGYRGVF